MFIVAFHLPGIAREDTGFVPVACRQLYHDTIPTRAAAAVAAMDVQIVTIPPELDRLWRLRADTGDLTTWLAPRTITSVLLFLIGCSSVLRVLLCALKLFLREEKF